VKRHLIKRLNILIYQVLHEYSFSEEIIKKWDDRIQYFEVISASENSRILEEKLKIIMQNCQIDLLTQLKNDEFNAVFQFVNDHIESNISLVDMSELNSMSTASFCKKFKSRTGMTLVQYINLKKIEQVKALLRENKYTLENIAEKVGFCNENYMIRVFKKVTGQTIKDYRKRSKDHIRG
jgi:AraC-like DNA-binding protein